MSAERKRTTSEFKQEKGIVGLDPQAVSAGIVDQALKRIGEYFHQQNDQEAYSDL